MHDEPMRVDTFRWHATAMSTGLTVEVYQSDTGVTVRFGDDDLDDDGRVVGNVFQFVFRHRAGWTSGDVADLFTRVASMVDTASFGQ